MTLAPRDEMSQQVGVTKPPGVSGTILVCTLGSMSLEHMGGLVFLLQGPDAHGVLLIPMARCLPCTCLLGKNGWSHPGKTPGWVSWELGWTAQGQMAAVGMDLTTALTRDMGGRRLHSGLQSLGEGTPCPLPGMSVSSLSLCPRE